MQNLTLPFEALPVHDSVLETGICYDGNARILSFELALVEGSSYAKRGPWIVVAFDVRDLDFEQDLEEYRYAQIQRRIVNLCDSGRRQCKVVLEPHQTSRDTDGFGYLDLDFSFSSTVAYPADD